MGPVIGAALLGYTKFLLGQQSVVDNTFILGIILVLAVLLLPNGIFPAVASAVKRISAKFSLGRGRNPRNRKGFRRRDSTNGNSNPLDRGQ